ncbi:uncharacterized protein METZ01_LOCUS430068 [marine metagenome]|uniref:Uncharacterized protein n=1 Tax=marine metagenome TaxID=408172 RepID=A0A382Y1Z2_9ZZZZ
MDVSFIMFKVLKGCDQGQTRRLVKPIIAVMVSRHKLYSLIPEPQKSL